MEIRKCINDFFSPGNSVVWRWTVATLVVVLVGFFVYFSVLSFWVIGIMLPLLYLLINYPAMKEELKKESAVPAAPLEVLNKQTSSYLEGDLQDTSFEEESHQWELGYVVGFLQFLHPTQEITVKEKEDDNKNYQFMVEQKVVAILMFCPNQIIFIQHTLRNSQIQIKMKDVRELRLYSDLLKNSLKVTNV